MGNGGISRAQQSALEQADKDLKEVLASAAGRRVLARLIDGSGVFLRSFTGNSETFYREGRRSVGLDLVEHVERVIPGTFAKMQAEALALRQRTDSRQQGGEDDDD